MKKKVAVAGLARLAAGIFWAGGAVAAGKGLFDAFLGSPEANFFSVKPWTIVTREQWFRWAGFEFAYGAACLALGGVLWVWAKRLPAWQERPVTEI
jgi:hypothetical protein